MYGVPVPFIYYCFHIQKIHLFVYLRIYLFENNENKQFSFIFISFKNNILRNNILKRSIGRSQST